MARDPKVTRKAYEYKLGKDLASKLDDKQIHLLSEYYNSLSDKETSDIDSQIVQGRNNTELHEMAIGMVEENESKKTPPKPKAKPKPKATPKAKAKPKKVYDEDRSVAYKLPDHILKDLDEDQIKDLSAVYNMMSADKKKEFAKGKGDLMDLARQMSDPLQEKYNTGGLDSWTGKPKENSNAKQGPMPMPSAKKKPDKKAVTAIVKKFSTEKKEDTKQPANETIDPKVLRLLGLEDTFDLDYDTYKTLLREKMAAGRMSKSQIPTEETELLTNEFKRVKSKTGRFKPTKKKVVNISKVVQSGRKYNKSAVNTQKLLSGSKETESNKIETKGKAVTDSFENINQTLVGIDSLLADILGEEKKESEQEAKTARKADQKAEEEKSEKSAKKEATKALKGFKAPKMGFLDMIKRFFGNILAGGFVLKMLDWIKNPENQKKIQNVVTFITDNLDKILIGIAAIVGIGIGGQILGFLTLFTPLVTGLFGVLSAMAPILAPIVAALLLWKGGQEGGKALQDLINRQRGGGQKETEDGVRYSDKSVESLRQNLSLLLQQTDKRTNIFGLPDWAKPYSEGEKREFLEDQLEKLKELQKRIRITKSVNDDLYRIQLNLKKGNAELERLRSSGASADKIERQEKFVKDLEKQEKTFSINKEQSVKIEQKLIGDIDFNELLKDPRIAKFIPDEIKDTLNKSADNVKVTPTSTPQTPMMPSSDGSVKKIIFGAGHAEDPNRPGSMLGTDGRPVQGTADDGSSGLNTPANATGVTESQLSRFVVDNLKKEVEARGLTDKIGFRDIYSWDGLRKVPQEVESTEGHQYVDIHADARGFGKAGVLPSANESATDRSLMKEFGRYSESFKPSSKGVTAGGGTLLEIGAIDDPKLRSLLLEAKSGNAGPATQEMINKILRGVLPSVGPKIEPVQKQEPPRPPGNQASATLPVGGEGAGGDEIASASGGRAAAASFSSTDRNNSSPQLTSSIFNLMAV